MAAGTVFAEKTKINELEAPVRLVAACVAISCQSSANDVQREFLISPIAVQDLQLRTE